MKRETKQLLKENNQREKLLTPASQAAMTDIVVYLRGCDLSEYHQEEVCRDIQEMVLEAEARGETMETVIGEDYKIFCHEIVSAFPPRSRKEKVLEQLDILLTALGILMIIWLVKSLVSTLAAGESVWYLTLTAGNLISWAVIVLVAEGLVWWVTKTALDEPGEESKVKTFGKVWVLACLVLVAIFLPGLFITSPALELCLPMAVFFALLPFGVLWVLDRNIGI